MPKKIGRNDPCPCGSGKKYKHCCMRADEANGSSAGTHRAPLQSSSLDAPKIKAYLGGHDVKPILDYLTALQLNPENHGKNLRIEHLCQLAVSAIGQSNKMPDIKTFKRLIDEEYPYDMMEDIPMNMFCETVVFHGGNYTFYPGLSTNVAELFRAMTESIYRVEDVFTEAFKKEIYQGVTLLLELGSAIAARAGIERMTRGSDNPRERIVEPQTIPSYAIPQGMMELLLRHNRLDKSVLDCFLLDKNDPKILTDNAEENPILYRPILELDGDYYFIGLTNQGCAINNFILKTAIKHQCLPELVRLTQETIWNRIGMACMNKMHWGPMDFDGFMPEDVHYNECLFRIDVNWVAYLCYAKDTEQDVAVDGAYKSARWNMDDRLKRTLAAIRKKEKTKDYHVLALVLYSSMGENFALMMNEQPDADYLVHFDAFNFLQLVQTEKWDNMSLVRYARTKEHTPALKFGMNQPLDCYSLYKHKGECFYVSDERKPDFIQIEPNEGCSLIHESKEKLDFHGTPMHIGGRVGYIPVQRDLDYAAIYKPINEGMNAKSCESYTLPIWVKCHQTEQTGLNPSSITDTVITAVAFWMDRLRPALEERLMECYKEPVEIDLQFSEEDLADKGIHYDMMKPAGEGKIKVARNATGVTVAFDIDFLRGFMGPDNRGERRMMAAIVTKLLDWDDAAVEAAIDMYIPLGPAKMILMTEVSNSPVSYPLWLNPPITIHKASGQLILDMFPQWMAEKGFDFDGRLQNKDQKDEFLHKGVDVLLEKAAQEVSRFDSRSLLRRLISNHETLVYQREHNKMLHPAQILCFGDTEEKRKAYFDDEMRLTESGLATRALIEYVAATQESEGKEQAGSDDIESLLALMSEVVHIGGICDAVHLEVSNHTIEKLASGRYGIYDDDFNDHVGDFANARSVESVNQQIEVFEDKMERLGRTGREPVTERDKKYDEIDEAFQADWGVSYTQLLQILYSSYMLAMKKQRSALDMEEKEFAAEIQAICPELNDDAIGACLKRLALDKRSDYLDAPEGMDGKEIIPWVYNRELSFLRRPYVRWQNEDGSTNVVFGFRSCLVAGLQLTDLLYAGRLKNVGKKLSKLLGRFESEKGAAFNEEVRAFLKQNSTLKVWDYDVSIKPKGNLVADADYGDIDVLAYDEARNVVYSIECKNTNTAKNVREMKKEMDDYLGRGENPEKDKKKALVMKHLRRHQWLTGHIGKVAAFVGAATEPEVKSVMLTSEVIPTSYLRRDDTPLPILNFPEMKVKGWEVMNES